MSTLSSKSDDSQTYFPLVLIFSTRERIRDILSVGLMQCHYRITQATNSNIASLKASQFVPDLIIADITANNTKDILMLNRLRHSDRTRNTPLLAVVPLAIKEKLEKILDTKGDITITTTEDSQFYLIEYPFSFSDLLKKIEKILNKYGKLLPEKRKKLGEEEQVKIRIGKRLFDANIPTNKKLQEIADVLHKQWVFPYTVIKALDVIGS
ncbi:unnamed protein product, partial [marine sediment metagenome]